MTICADLLTAASAQLHGYGTTQDRVTSLTADIGPTDTSFVVDFTSGQAVGITPGIVEIGSELLYVVTVDQGTSICTIAPGFGRGYRGTTAATHSAGAMVTSRPKFPRIDLLQQMNDIIGGLFPQLFAVRTFTGTVTFPLNSYTLTNSPKFIIDVQWQDPIGNWQRAPAYMLDPFDASFRLGSGPMIGRPLRVLYATEPVKFAAETDNFTVTGLPDSCQDLLKLGTVAHLVPGLDISRAQNASVEQSDRNKVVPPFAGVNAAKYIMAEYQDRLQNEVESLRALYPPRLVRTW